MCKRPSCITGTETDPAVFSHHAQEDTELCQECPGETHHRECRSCWGGQPRCDTGCRICQTGSQGCLYPGVSTENPTTGNILLLLLFF